MRCIETASRPSASAIRMAASAIPASVTAGFGPRLGTGCLPQRSSVICRPLLYPLELCLPYTLLCPADTITSQEANDEGSGFRCERGRAVGGPVVGAGGTRRDRGRDRAGVGAGGGSPGLSWGGGYPGGGPGGGGGGGW